MKKGDIAVSLLLSAAILLPSCASPEGAVDDQITSQTVSDYSSAELERGLTPIIEAHGYLNDFYNDIDSYDDVDRLDADFFQVSARVRGTLESFNPQHIPVSDRCDAKEYRDTVTRARTQLEAFVDSAERFADGTVDKARLNLELEFVYRKLKEAEQARESAEQLGGCRE